VQWEINYLYLYLYLYGAAVKWWSGQVEKGWSGEGVNWWRGKWVKGWRGAGWTSEGVNEWRGERVKGWRSEGVKRWRGEEVKRWRGEGVKVVDWSIGWSGVGLRGEGMCAPSIKKFHSYIWGFLTHLQLHHGYSQLRIFHSYQTFETATFMENSRGHGYLGTLDMKDMLVPA
jgi:hypothetical protein